MRSPLETLTGLPQSAARTAPQAPKKPAHPLAALAAALLASQQRPDASSVGAPVVRPRDLVYGNSLESRAGLYNLENPVMTAGVNDAGEYWADSSPDTGPAPFLGPRPRRNANVNKKGGK